MFRLCILRQYITVITYYCIVQNDSFTCKENNYQNFVTFHLPWSCEMSRVIAKQHQLYKLQGCYYCGDLICSIIQHFTGFGFVQLVPVVFILTYSSVSYNSVYHSNICIHAKKQKYLVHWFYSSEQSPSGRTVNFCISEHSNH